MQWGVLMLSSSVHTTENSVESLFPKDILTVKRGGGKADLRSLISKSPNQSQHQS